MTEQLFLNDSYLLQCVGTVLSCEPAEEGYDVICDRTVLFPTGGGQPCDTGTLDGHAVLDVRLEGDTVIHRLQEPVAVGTRSEIRVDWPRRFDHMQQHTGEHLLSFAAKEMFGAVNVGFHLAATYGTVDFDVPLDAAQVDALEERVNQLITNDTAITLEYTTLDQLDKYTLRRKAADLTDPVRIVWMEQADSCTCCGTHCHRTGEAGPLKITAAVRYKGGVRLTFLCGMRAVRHAAQTQHLAEEAARQFSTSVEELPRAVNRALAESAALQRKLHEAENALNGYLAKELQENARAAGKYRLAIRLFPGMDPARLRPLALSVCAGGDTLTLLLAKQEDAVRYVLAASDGVPLDAGELCGAVNAALGGKGGGRGSLAQGSAPAGAIPALTDTMAQLEEYLLRRLQAV